jgi:hypothetical protein
MREPRRSSVFVLLLTLAMSGCNTDVALLIDNGRLTLRISVNPDTVTLVINGNAQAVEINLARQGDTGPLNLTTSGVPSGVTAQAQQPGMLDNGKVTFQATSNAQPVSSADVVITASDGRVFDTATVRLTITR